VYASFSSISAPNTASSTSVSRGASRPPVSYIVSGFGVLVRKFPLRVLLPVNSIGVVLWDAKIHKNIEIFASAK
jgi:hypothetical protein